MTLQKIHYYPFRLIAVLTLAAGCCLLLVNLYLWQRFHVHIPMHDTVRDLPLVQAALERGVGSTRLEDWLAAHAGAHRVALTRWLMFIDFSYFGGQNHFIYVSAWLGVLVILMVYISAFRQSFRAATWSLLFVIGILLLFLSSPTQFWNFVNPINNSWYMVFASSALALWLIASKPTAPGPVAVMTAFLLAAIAAFSNFAGVIVWLLLPVLIAIRNARAGLLAALCSALFVWLYCSDVTPDGAVLIEHTDSPESNKPTLAAYLVHQVTRIATLSSTYLGSPLSIDRPGPAHVLVALSCTPIAAGWVMRLKQRIGGVDQHNAWLELTLAMATLCLGIALATQLGRIELSQPMAERYQTVVMLYWLNICGLLVFFGLRINQGSAVAQTVAATLSLCCIVSLLTTSAGGLSRAVRDAGVAHQIASMGAVGVTDFYVHRRLLNHKSPDYFSAMIGFLQRHNAAYSGAQQRRYNFDKTARCAHVELTAQPSRWPALYSVTGTVSDHWSKLYRRMAVTNARGDVIGQIYPVYHRHKQTVRSLLLPKNNAWQGYIGTQKISKDYLFVHYRSPPLAKLSCRIDVV